MKNWKKWILGLFIALAMTASIQAEGKDSTNVVLLIDSSGSMQENDPQRLAIESTKIFVNLCELDWQEYRAGIISFSDKINSRSEMISMAEQTGKEKLWSEAENIRYDGDTDIGAAMKEGVDLVLSKVADLDDEQEKKILILLTDGKIDLGDSAGRTAEDSMVDVESSLADAQAAGIQIYAIGLNNGGQVDESLLEKIAGSSYRQAGSDAELEEIFIKIFADQSNADVTSETEDVIEDEDSPLEKTVNIPNQSVMKAEIVLSSSGHMRDMEVLNPQGEDVLGDSSKVTRTDTGHSVMFRLLYPGMGDWTVKVYGDKGDVINTTMLFTYDLELVQQTDTEKPYQEGDKITVSGVLKKAEKTLKDEELLKNFSGVVLMKTPNGQIQEIPMVRTAETFSASLTAGQKGIYEISIKLTSKRQDGESIEYSTEFQKIEVAESEAEKNAAGKNKESEADKKNGNKGLLAGGLAALALLIIIGLILLIKKPWKSAAGFGGELRYRFRNLDTGIYSERETCMLLGKKGTLSLGTMLDTDSKTKKLLELNKVSLSAISDMDGSGGIKVSIRTDKIKNDLFEGKGELILTNHEECVLETRDGAEHVMLELRYDE